MMVDVPARALLQEAGWSPRRWAAEINSLLVARGRGRDRIHPTCPYHWLSSGRPPKEPFLAALAAEALSVRLARPVMVDCVWPQTVDQPGAEAARPATGGLLGCLAREQVLAQLDGLASSGSRFQVAGPTQVLAAVHDGLRAPTLPPAVASVGDRVLPPMLTVITGHIAELRRLDDRTGGGVVSLRYVRAELRAVLDLVRHASYSSGVGAQLLSAAAELCQLAGWMWFDGGDVGTAQRAFLLGIRLARAAQDTDVLANMLGMLAYITAHTGDAGHAIRLAEHAGQLAARRGSMLRSRTAGRLATAYAAAGDIHGYRGAAESAHAQLGRPATGQTPSFLYYLSGAQLNAESGQALLRLADLNPPTRAALLSEAISHLTPLSAADLRQDYQRSALLHGCYLAQAHLAARDIESASHATRTALRRLPAVQSRRCIALLVDLRVAFARRRRNPWARDAADELDAALSAV